MKRLNLYLSWLLVLKMLNFKLPFKFVMIILGMTFITSFKMIISIDKGISKNKKVKNNWYFY